MRGICEFMPELLCPKGNWVVLFQYKFAGGSEEGYLAAKAHGAADLG